RWLHRQGLGTILLLAWLEALRLRPDIEQVVLDTSQHTQAFYARFGFVVKRDAESPQSRFPVPRPRPEPVNPRPLPCGPTHVRQTPAG
ncbi:GNAT family N-acetyltransferase, partial [Xanthomonas sp. Kuri4-1]